MLNSRRVGIEPAALAVVVGGQPIEARAKHRDHAARHQEDDHRDHQIRQRAQHAASELGCHAEQVLGQALAHGRV